MQLLVTTGPVYAPESQFCNEKILENSDMTGLEWGGVLQYYFLLSLKMNFKHVTAGKSTLLIHTSSMQAKEHVLVFLSSANTRGL